MVCSLRSPSPSIHPSLSYIIILESIDDEDEILLALAEELGDFSEYVGGSNHAHLLLAPLETLAAVEETVVRDKVTASSRVVEYRAV